MFLVEYQDNSFVDIDNILLVHYLCDDVEFTLNTGVDVVYKVSKPFKNKFLSMLQYRDMGKERIAERYGVYDNYSQE